jgi:N-acetylmuramoyl-L-alanine amidase
MRAGRPSPPNTRKIGAASRATLIRQSIRISSRIPFLLAMIWVLVAVAAVPAAAQEDPASRRTAAQAQFERAEAMRATLEAKSERERSLREYETLVTTYRRVYLITPHAMQVPPAIKAVGDLYRRMGEQFEARYFASAVKAYEFLIRDYPDTKYREESLLAIADIQRNYLSEKDLAQKGYEDFLEQYPRSSYAAQARKALAELQAPAKTDKPVARELPGKAMAANSPATSPATSAATSPANGPASSLPAGTPAATSRSVTTSPVSAPATSSATAPASGASSVAEAAPGQAPEVSSVRIWNADNYTRIIIELGGQAKYQAARISDPDRIYFDIENAKLSNELLHQPIEVPAGSYLKAVRVAQNRADVVRVVLDVAKVKDYSVFELASPDRLVVDVYGPGGNKSRALSASATNAVAGTEKAANAGSASSSASSARPATATTANATPASPAAANSATASAATKPVTPPAVRTGQPATKNPVVGLLPLSVKAAPALLPMPGWANPFAGNPFSDKPLSVKTASNRAETGPSSTPEKGESGRNESVKSLADSIGPAPAAKPARNGERSLTRALGLKIGRIVIDPGHGGHDTGSIGPTGLMEKDLCLDVAQRLGKLIQENFPSAEIVYTRQADRFVGLEQRTAIANGARADLFISIHANSSDDAKASGIETYYLNFNASPQAMAVAARENATAQSSVHDLQDLVAKIARNEKIEESRDLASDIQESLASSVQGGSRPGRNRGVRKAPFVVLVGADMPSVLAEISFISNPADEQSLKKPENRQRAADGLFRGIEKYLRSVNSLTTTISPAISPR